LSIARRLLFILPVRLALGLLVAAGCTAFEGLEPREDVTPPPGGGGAGGEAPEGPRSLLPLLDAANLCSLVFRCPTLGGSILLSTGLPLVATDENARPTVWNYSACIDWLTAPLESGRVGFDDLRDAVVRVAPATTCEDAVSLLAFDVAEDVASVCPGAGGGGSGGGPQGTCAGAGALSCPTGITGRCDDDIFGVSSECKVSAEGDVRCALDSGCTTPGITCDGGFVVDCSASGFKTALSCERYGLACQSGAGCVTPSGPVVCSALGEQTCGVGQRAQACAVGSPPSLHMAEVDCAAMAMTCTPEGNTARCAPAGAACSPYDADQNRCEGDTAIVCVQGQSIGVDCVLLGKTCQPASMDGSQSAHCG
jgi:hypothetical protein